MKYLRLNWFWGSHPQRMLKVDKGREKERKFALDFLYASIALVIGLYRIAPCNVDQCRSQLLTNL